MEATAKETKFCGDVKKSLEKHLFQLLLLDLSGGDSVHVAVSACLPACLPRHVPVRCNIQSFSHFRIWPEALTQFVWQSRLTATSLLFFFLSPNSTGAGIETRPLTNYGTLSFVYHQTVRNP